MSRSIVLSPNEYYHIYNRGTEKRDIFMDEADYKRFLSLMYLCNGQIKVDIKLQGSTFDEVVKTDRGTNLVEISCYCLMPNHFHFLIRENTDGGISAFMQKITTGYTMYFNKRHERTGSLFQGKFKAKHANKDNYLKYLISYIHLNPVKLINPGWKDNSISNRAAAKRFLQKYNYSSYLDYLEQSRHENAIVAKKSLPEYFNNNFEFENLIDTWLENYNETALQGSTL